jgi:hypothetical protein
VLKPAGIAKDGHIMYGPYDQNGAEWACRTDVCNGITQPAQTANDHYIYTASKYFPYVPPCFGLANSKPAYYPKCTQNNRKYSCDNTGLQMLAGIGWAASMLIIVTLFL